MSWADYWDSAIAQTLLGRPLVIWAAALMAGLLTMLVLQYGARTLFAHAERLSQRTHTSLDDLLVETLRGTRSWLLAAVGLLVTLQMLDLPARWQHRVDQLWFVVIALQLALWGSRALKLVLQRHLERHVSVAQSGASATLLAGGLQTALWTTVLLAVLANLGFNITAVVTSLGIGGIAVALAVQNILGDLFASLAIALDKPFEVGDAIAVNNVSGTVERVGLKTTRIRAPGGEQIVMSNADLLKSAVSNYKRLAQRRIELRFSLSLATPAAAAKAVPLMVRELLEKQADVRFDRAHLKRITESALEFEVVYIVLKADYAVHMAVQQEMWLGLMTRLEAAGIRFAAPPGQPLAGPAPAATPVAAQPKLQTTP
jgi:small-conductance mechanosensitive channel